MSERGEFKPFNPQNQPVGKDLQDQLTRDMGPLAKPKRYVFFVAGHIMVHPPLSAKLNRYTTPFEVVITLDQPITDEATLEKLRLKTKALAGRQLAEAAPNHLVADVTIRNLSLLHTLQD